MAGAAEFINLAAPHKQSVVEESRHDDGVSYLDRTILIGACRHVAVPRAAVRATSRWILVTSANIVQSLARGRDRITVTRHEIAFDDGAAYEKFMGLWSRLAGARFIEWLDLPPGLRWLDVGCGSGAFTELLVRQCAPSAIAGIDPSEAQLDFARSRVVSPVVQFRQGDAVALPFADDAFDAAVMPLVIFFVREPALAIAEMTRVVVPGGSVTAYAWDMPGGGFPYAMVHAAARSLGVEVPSAPSPEASRLDVLEELWSSAGLEAVDTLAISVQRTFADFEDYWETLLGGASIGRQLTELGREDRDRLRAMLRDGLPAPDSGGRITTSARANAIRGRVRQGA